MGGDDPSDHLETSDGVKVGSRWTRAVQKDGEGGTFGGCRGGEEKDPKSTLRHAEEIRHILAGLPTPTPCQHN